MMISFTKKGVEQQWIRRRDSELLIVTALEEGMGTREVRRDFRVLVGIRLKCLHWEWTCALPV